ncbi:protein SIEVE ELEMENT OCCLUSION C [Rosa rugosa]|uniref:protein SIEVE ELEMENT OCCLUSION C n=1 Tax=Rosa rugosa TaxID=74645 RepID=UPI002B4010A7|nr:protein SIEVE ELEMENT OCCLUSION C [Rosa rugosa]
MNMLGSDPFLPQSISSLAEEVLIKKLLLSHDPDGRHFDSELFLCAVENIMLCTTAEEVPDDVNLEKIEVVGLEEPLGKTFGKISHEILCKLPDQEDLHTRTMLLFDLLGSYKWDAKVVLVLASFVASYGELRLLMQLCSSNPLALSVTMLKQLPADMSPLKPRFKALSLLVNAMVDVTKYIIKFEKLPLSHVELDHEAKNATKSIIYIAVYWIIRGILRCASQITDSTLLKSEQYSDSTIIATWEVLSLVYRLRSIYSRLRQQVEICHQQTETKLYWKLMNVFQETHVDNQEVLRFLFAMRDDLPLKDCSSQAKLGVSDLKGKIVILLFSRPEFLSIDETLLLVQQTHNHHHYKYLEGSYRIVWIPIPVSSQWTTADATMFDFLSSIFPWYSVRKPWLLNSAVVAFIKEAWNYKNEPVVVVLDSQGNVTNKNVLDMLLIWGVIAYPFSASRENELWQEQNWTLQFMVDAIDPCLTKWVEEDRNICIYGSNNIDWILEFTGKMEIIKSAGVKLEMVYVGKRNSSQQTRNILTRVDHKQLSSVLSFIKSQLFWLRLQSIRRSKLRLGKPETTDHVLDEVSALLDMDGNDTNWAVIGRGSNSMDMVRLKGPELMECLDMFPKWGGSVAELGFLSALRNSLEPSFRSGPCGHDYDVTLSSEEPALQGMVDVCGKCKHPMKKFVIYK